MRCALRWVVWGVLALATPALAQHGIQQKSVSGVRLQTRIVKGDAKTRCVAWLPLRPSQARTRYVELDPYGKEGITVMFSAVFNKDPKDCPLAFDIKRISKIGERTQTSGKKIYDFQLLVEPPAAVIRATSPGTEEELVVDAPIEADSDQGFFEFFSRSTIYFENRFTMLSTDSPSTDIRSVILFPVFGGKISSPLPFLTNWFGGYSLFQNLGSFVPGQPAEVAYSEFLFDLTYRRVWKRAGIQFGLAGELRGRNVYQVGEERPYIIGQVLRPGIAAKVLWFPGFYSGFGKSKIRFGFDVEYHYLSLGNLAGSNIRQQALEATLHYRLSSRGPLVLGLGYSQFLQSVLVEDISGSRINENTRNFYVRISLFPVRTKESE